MTTVPKAGVENSPSGYRRWMMTLLTVTYGLNLLDRQVINVLVEPIKHDLHLADWQLGALTGLSFALLYSIMALPIARLADRGDRVRIIGLAILTWSLFTAACGLTGNFVQLLLMRVGVGVGEAGCAPPSQSLIADHYPPEQRAAALAKFAFGLPIGASLGLAAGGVLGDLVGWRWTLVAAGAPGVLLALLVLCTLRDPRRDSPKIVEAPPPLAGVLRRMARCRAFVFLCLGVALAAFVNYGAMAFAGSFYLRLHGEQTAALGRIIGVGPIAVVGIGIAVCGTAPACLGAYVGGRLADHMGQRDPRAYALIPAVGSLMCVAGFMATFMAPSAAAAFIIFSTPSFFGNMWHGPTTHAFQSLVGPRSRATALAVVLVATSALGLGLGPLVVGALSDAFARTMGPGPGLHMALMAGVSVGFISSLCYWLASRTLKQDLAAAAKAELDLD